MHHFASRFVLFVQAMFPRHGVLKDVDHSGGLGVSSPKQFQEHLTDTPATRATHCNPLQPIATHCNLLQPIATHSLLYHPVSIILYTYIDIMISLYVQSKLCHGGGNTSRSTMPTEKHYKSHSYSLWLKHVETC